MSSEYELADWVKVKIPEISDEWLLAEVIELDPVIVILWNRLPYSYGPEVVYGPNLYTEIEHWDR